jgi:hypothetical protein
LDFLDGMRYNDEPLGRRADVVEWVAGHQGEQWPAGVVEYSGVFWPHYARRIDLIESSPVRRCEQYLILRTDSREATKKRITVSSENDISIPSRQSGAGYVPDAYG